MFKLMLQEGKMRSRGLVVEVLQETGDGVTPRGTPEKEGDELGSHDRRIQAQNRTCMFGTSGRT